MAWAHGGIMSGMVIRRIVTAILAKVLLGDIVKTGLMAVTLVLLVSISGAAQRGTGSVCVAARIDNPFWKEPATLPNGEINSHGLKVRVDRRPVEEGPQRKSLKIDGLDISERHLLVVLDSSGKPIDSLRIARDSPGLVVARAIAWSRLYFSGICTKEFAAWLLASRYLGSHHTSCTGRCSCNPRT